MLHNILFYIPAPVALASLFIIFTQLKKLLHTQDLKTKTLTILCGFIFGWCFSLAIYGCSVAVTNTFPSIVYSSLFFYGFCLVLYVIILYSGSYALGLVIGNLLRSYFCPQAVAWSACLGSASMILQTQAFYWEKLLLLNL